MITRQLTTHIQRRPPRLLIKPKPTSLRSPMEPIPRMIRRQRLQERTVRFANAVIELIPTRPERIPTRFRQEGKPQSREVRRRLFKGDIRVPDCSEVAIRALVQLLVLERVDSADLRVWVAEFPGVVDDGVDV